ncbi:MAG: class II aldolase/adducin family protein [Anaerovoracaceae bacterium]|jgi:L-fuculose-phosphate aldolase
MQVRDEQRLREELVEYGKKLLASGLVQGTWGNLSTRLSDSEMLVTPSGMDYERILPENIVKVDIETLQYEGDLKPTSECSLHAAIYQMSPDAGAVIHTHSKYCSIFAAARMPLQVESKEKQRELGEIIRCAEYGLAGTKTLRDNTCRALGSAAGCLMAAHGMICRGADLEDAFRKCRLMEEAAEESIERRIKQNAG